MFNRIATPVMTPFDENNQLDLHALGENIEKLIQSGIDGIVLLGSCGEFYSMTMDEKKSLIEYCCKKIAGRAYTMIGTGSNILAEVLELNDHAKKCGANAALLVSPYYFGFNETIVTQFYEHVLAVSEIDIIAYNFPERTGYDLTAKQLAYLAQKFPRLVGVKDTTTLLSHTRELVNTIKPLRPDFHVYSGYDEQFLPNLMMGGDGAIAGLSNIIPDVFVELREAFAKKEMATAMTAAQKICRLMPIYGLADPFIIAIKEAMRLCDYSILANGRFPIPTISKEQSQAIAALLKAEHLL